MESQVTLSDAWTPIKPVNLCAQQKAGIGAVGCYERKAGLKQEKCH